MRRLINLVLPALLFLVLGGCVHRSPMECRDEALFAATGSRQAVLVSVQKDANPSRVDIRRYERSGGCWQEIGAPVDGMAGRNGLAPQGEKREGDGRTPSGIFALERGFGYAPLETRIPYIVVNREMIWIDDPKSPLYNTLAGRDDGQGFSYEEMKRNDDLYKYGIVIEYNTKNIVAGAGSAIFFHVWRDRETATAGCVAAAEHDMAEMLQWLDPAQKPVAIIGYPDEFAGPAGRH